MRRQFNSWPYIISYGLEWFWILAGVACLFAALALVFRPALFKEAESDLFSSQKFFKGRYSLLFLSLVFPLLASTSFKLAQYYSFEFPAGDSVSITNVLWNITHGYGSASSIHYGVSLLSIHFNVTVLLLAPFFWIWPSTLVPLLAHGIAIGSAPLAAYFLAEHRSQRPVLGWLALLLVFSNPLFHSCLQTHLTSCVYALPLVLWTAYFWGAGKKLLGVLSGLLLITTWEHSPIVLFGFGLYFLADRDRQTRKWVIAALLLGSPILWFSELALVNFVRGQGFVVQDHWAVFYGHLGGSLDGVLRNIFCRPWLFLWNLFLPPQKLWIIGETLLHVALLPLASGSASLPLVIAWIPQQLAGSGNEFQMLRGHYASFIAGPLLWASIMGMLRLFRTHASRHSNILASAILCAVGVNFLGVTTRLYPGLMPSSWKTAVPKIRAYIPPDSKVWCEPFIAPHFAARRYIQMLPRNGPFELQQFMPDRVIFSTYWVEKAEHELTGQLFTYWEREGFVPIFREADLVVLSRLPEASHFKYGAALTAGSGPSKIKR
ncbi:MAG: DUF2079 domain-containing protein [Elusimicrobiota bacterium]|jgi:uncharacterized membrane protein